MDYPSSVHTRVDTLAQQLPFFFEIVYEKIFVKDPAIFKRRNGDLRLCHVSPSVTDCINRLLREGNSDMNNSENAKVFRIASWSNRRGQCCGGFGFLFVWLALWTTNPEKAQVNIAQIFPSLQSPKSSSNIVWPATRIQSTRIFSA